MSQLQDARARIAELEAAIEAEKDAQAAATAAAEPARKRKAALRARHAKVQLLTQAGGQPNSDGGGIASITLAYLGPSWARDVVGKRPKDAAEALVSGQSKMQAIGGIAYSLRGFLQRTRTTDKARMRPVVLAEKRRRRAQLALKEAWAAERQAYIEAYDAGDKLDPRVIAAEIAKRFVIDDNEPSIDQSIRDRAWEARRDLPEAQQHLAWVKAKNPDKGVCPCRNCASDRAEAIRAKNEAERIAALPTGLFNCPVCKRRHRGSHDVQAMYGYQLSDKLAELLDADAPGWREATEDPERRNTHLINRIYCAKGRTWFLWTTEIKRRIEAAAKKAARTPRVEWTCPNPECAEDVITAKPGPDDELVECPVCGIEANIPSLVMRRYVDKKAA